jgi:hypothetical protein
MLVESAAAIYDTLRPGIPNIFPGYAPVPQYTHGWVSLYGGDLLSKGRKMGQVWPGVEELKRIARFFAAAKNAPKIRRQRFPCPGGGPAVKRSTAWYICCITTEGVLYDSFKT